MARGKRAGIYYLNKYDKVLPPLLTPFPLSDIQTPSQSSGIEINQPLHGFGQRGLPLGSRRAGIGLALFHSRLLWIASRQ